MAIKKHEAPVEHTAPVAPVVKTVDAPVLPAHQGTGKCVHCDKPVESGQTYVCRDHMRAA